MIYRLTIYCPDTHLCYDGRTPDREGVGGGVMARIRLAQALARLGHRVTLVANVPRRQRHRGVDYRPLDEVGRIDGDILILNTSGGALDLSPVLRLELNVRLREVWVQGYPRVASLGDVGYDYLIAPSNFIRRVARDEWGVAPRRLGVFHNGLQRFAPRLGIWPWPPRRNPFRLAYASHPSKGFDAAVAILRLLRAKDPRFELHVYGGHGLWGGDNRGLPREDGVVFHGLVGQPRLSRELERTSVLLSLQAIQEAFSLVLAEAMAAGNVVIASPVGGIPEAIRHGYDGFLLPGDHTAPQTHEKAARLVRDLVERPSFCEYVRRNARAAHCDWNTLARAWQDHWSWSLGDTGSEASRGSMEGVGSCPECDGVLLGFADGYHCRECGCYTRTPRPDRL